MCSIRNGCVVMLIGMMLALAAASAGCQAISKKQPLSPVNNTPLVVDEAMQIRDWDRSTNYYQNGGTIAGGTGYCWETADWVKEQDRKLTDVPVAVLNFACMPVGLFVNSPFRPEVYHGEVVPPTYTGQPPLPGSPEVNRAEGMEVPTATEGGRAAEPGTPPPAPPAVETPPAAPETPAPTTPTPAPSDIPTTPSPSDTPAPPPAPVAPPTAESAPPPAPPTAEPPSPSSVPAPPAQPSQPPNK